MLLRGNFIKKLHISICCGMYDYDFGPATSTKQGKTWNIMWRLWPMSKMIQSQQKEFLISTCVGNPMQADGTKPQWPWSLKLITCRKQYRSSDIPTQDPSGSLFWPGVGKGLHLNDRPQTWKHLRIPRLMSPVFACGGHALISHQRAHQWMKR